MSRRPYILIALGIIFVVIAIVLGSCWSSIFSYVLTSNLILANNSNAYKLWIETPLPMYLDVYLFNCTNAAEFQKNPSKVKPYFQEVGPFTFREIHDRVGVSWNDADGTVSYNQTRKWLFVPEVSVDLNSNITNMNVIALGAANAMDSSGYVFHSIVSAALRVYGSLFVTNPAGQWLFDGMHIKLLDLLNKPWIKKFIPIPIPYDKFGFFYNRNMSASYDGRFTALTGAKGLSKLGMLTEWNNKNKTDFYEGACGIVNGSSGEIFPPLSADEKEFSLFITDVCSPLTLKYNQDVPVEKLVGKQFVGDETMFDNGELKPENSCFCQGECQPKGVRNLTLCRQGAPVFASYPHFYLADPSYINAIGGMSPNKSEHEFRLTIDPVSGIPLDVRAQIQINMRLRPMNFSLYQRVPKAYIPMLWFRQRAQITSDLAGQDAFLESFNVFGAVINSLLALLGLALGVYGIIILRNKPPLEDEEPIITAADDS